MQCLQKAGRYAVAGASFVAGFWLYLLPGPAAAHIIQGAQGGFGSGFAHPLTGPDHFLAMFAVGLWGAQMGGRQVWTLPVTFPLIMVVGGVIGMLGVPLPAIEIGIALSILALGLAIALAWRPAEWIALILIAYFALCHGYAHGAELPLSADPGRLRHWFCAGDRHDPSVRHRRRPRAQQTYARPTFTRARRADRRWWNLFPCPRTPCRLTRARASSPRRKSGAARPCSRSACWALLRSRCWREKTHSPDGF